jgi:transposase
MAKAFRPDEPHQSFLLPPSPMDWLRGNHLARLILELVETLDLSDVLATYERELRGFPPHNPRMKVGLLLYACCVGIPSSRKIERRTCAALAALFVQVLKLCQRMGLVKLGNVSLDGLALYRKRKTTVEPVFGLIKNRGFRALLLRGLEKVRHEWALIAMSPNVSKLHRDWCSTPA